LQGVVAIETASVQDGQILTEHSALSGQHSAKEEGKSSTEARRHGDEEVNPQHRPFSSVFPHYKIVLGDF
jgi:hypothetical protein